MHAGGRPRRREAVVDRPPLGGGPAVGLVHRQGARLELERGGDPVERLQPLARDVLAVAVQVDEPRAHDEPRGVDGGGSGKGLLADLPDGTAGDPDVADRIEAGLGVDHPAAAEDEVVHGRHPLTVDLR